MLLKQNDYYSLTSTTYFDYQWLMKRGFGFYLDRTLKTLSSVYIKHFKANSIDLTIEQWVILQRIYELGSEASQVEISKISYRNRATTSRVIGGLISKGLVKKDRFKGDLKRYRLVITSKGNKVVQKVLPITRDLREVGYNNINKKDFDTFLKVLDQLWSNYDEYEIP